jgi:hypothetical protein
LPGERHVGLDSLAWEGHVRLKHGSLAREGHVRLAGHRHESFARKRHVRFRHGSLTRKRHVKLRHGSFVRKRHMWPGKRHMRLRHGSLARKRHVRLRHARKWQMEFRHTRFLARQGHGSFARRRHMRLAEARNGHVRRLTGHWHRSTMGHRSGFHRDGRMAHGHLTGQRHPRSLAFRHWRLWARLVLTEEHRRGERHRERQLLNLLTDIFGRIRGGLLAQWRAIFSIAESHTEEVNQFRSRVNQAFGHWRKRDRAFLGRSVVGLVGLGIVSLKY